MKANVFHIVLLLFVALQVNAQITTVPKGKRLDAQQKEQIAIDDQLATQFFHEQDYASARDLYENLFEKTGQISYFQQFIECLLNLKDYDQAEKELKSFAKKNPSYFRAATDLVYVYTLQGKTDKAKKQFNEITKDLPDNAPTIRSLSYAFQNRGLNDLAMSVLEKGTVVLNGKESLYMDMAYLNQSMANYQEAFRYYFLELEAHPGQYNNIRNRLQSMMFYDVNHSISDELRIALLKHTQEKPDNLEFAQLLVWFALQQEDYDIAFEFCQYQR